MLLCAHTISCATVHVLNDYVHVLSDSLQLDNSSYVHLLHTSIHHTYILCYMVWLCTCIFIVFTSSQLFICTVICTFIAHINSVWYTYTHNILCYMVLLCTYTFRVFTASQLFICTSIAHVHLSLTVPYAHSLSSAIKSLCTCTFSVYKQICLHVHIL